MSAWGSAALPRAALAVVLAALGAVYWIALEAPAVGVFHDDGVYAVTAKALATGRGYRILSLPSEIPQTKYPFLFPLLLAGIWKILPHFPDNLVFLKAAPLACALLWWRLSYGLLKRETGDARVALFLTLLTAASPWVLFLSTTLLSETLFAALGTGALLLLGRLEDGLGATAELAGAAVLASAALLTRTAGVALILAGVVVLLLRRQSRKAALFALLCATLCAPWIAWQAQQDQLLAGVTSYYARSNYAAWNVLFHFAGGQKLRIVGQNLLSLLVSPAALMGVPATGWGAALALVWGALTVFGFARRLAQGPRALEVFVLLYAGMIVLWAWPPMRFLAPLLPAILWFGFRGAVESCRWLGLGGRVRAGALAVMGAILLVPCGWALVQQARAARDLGAIGIPHLPQDDWRQTELLLDWVAHNTPPDAVLMGNLDPTLYLYSGRKSVRAFVQDPFLLHYAGDPKAMPLGGTSELMDRMASYRVRYLVCTPNRAFREGPFLRRLVAEFIAAYPGAVRKVYQGDDPAYCIYQIQLPAILLFPTDSRY